MKKALRLAAAALLAGLVLYLVFFAVVAWILYGTIGKLMLAAVWVFTTWLFYRGLRRYRATVVGRRGFIAIDTETDAKGLFGPQPVKLRNGKKLKVKGKQNE